MGRPRRPRPGPTTVRRRTPFAGFPPRPSPSPSPSPGVVSVGQSGSTARICPCRRPMASGDERVAAVDDGGRARVGPACLRLLLVGQRHHAQRQDLVDLGGVVQVAGALLGHLGVVVEDDRRGQHDRLVTDEDGVGAVTPAVLGCLGRVVRRVEERDERRAVGDEHRVHGDEARGHHVGPSGLGVGLPRRDVLDRHRHLGEASAGRHRVHGHAHPAVHREAAPARTVPGRNRRPPAGPPSPTRPRARRRAPPWWTVLPRPGRAVGGRRHGRWPRPTRRGGCRRPRGRRPPRTCRPRPGPRPGAAASAGSAPARAASGRCSRPARGCRRGTRCGPDQRSDGSASQ